MLALCEIYTNTYMTTKVILPIGPWHSKGYWRLSKFLCPKGPITDSLVTFYILDCHNCTHMTFLSHNCNKLMYRLVYRHFYAKKITINPNQAKNDFIKLLATCYVTTRCHLLHTSSDWPGGVTW